MKKRLSSVRKFGGGDFNKDEFDAWTRRNPAEWEELKKLMDIGRNIVLCQLNNMVGGFHEEILRMFLQNYVDRYLSYGTRTFPTSYPGVELFMNFNLKHSIIELVYEEELYVVSLKDFLNHITDKEYNFENLNLEDEIPEDLIYHFEFNDGVEEFPVVCDNDQEFIVGHVSLIRRKNEVAVMLQAGLKIDPNNVPSINAELEKEEITNDKLTDYRKQIGFEILNPNGAKPKVVHYLDDQSLWLHTILVRFDIESKTIDYRYIGKDCNTTYSVFTDSIGALVTEKNMKINERSKELHISYLEKLEEHRGLIEFATYCMSLPNYVFEREDKIVEVEYLTQIKNLIKGAISRRKYRDVPLAVQPSTKTVYYVESPSISISKFMEIQDSSFTIETSGFWKQIDPSEMGIDKKNRPVKGRTWVEKNETYYIEKEGVFRVNSKVEYTGPNAGSVYIMRDPGKGKNIYKVGLSRRDIETRRKELSNTSVEDQFYVIFSYATKDCVEAEKMIHNELVRYRISSRREFFSCDFKIIKDVCDRIISEINEVN